MTLRDKRDPYVYGGSWLQEASDEVEKRAFCNRMGVCLHRKVCEF